MLDTNINYVPIRISTCGAIQCPDSIPRATQYIIRQTGALCWNCAHTFDWEPLAIPLQFERHASTLPGFGYFCSFNCMKRYALQYGTSSLSKTTPLIAALMRRLRAAKGYSAIVVTAAPTKELLVAFGGHMSIEEYRAEFIIYDGSRIGVDETKVVDTRPDLSLRRTRAHNNIDIYDFRMFFNTECVSINREPRLTENLMCMYDTSDKARLEEHTQAPSSGKSPAKAPASATKANTYKRRKGRPPRSKEFRPTINLKTNTMSNVDMLKNRRSVLENTFVGQDASTSNFKVDTCPGIVRKPRTTLVESMGMIVLKENGDTS